MGGEGKKGWREEREGERRKGEREGKGKGIGEMRVREGAHSLRKTTPCHPMAGYGPADYSKFMRSCVQRTYIGEARGLTYLLLTIST